MDKKQNRILNDIKEKFGFPEKINFIQYRNLKEFKYFSIERINPNHKIILFGKLKKHRYKNNYPKGLVKVGEIIIPCITLFLNFNMIIEYINIICLMFNLFFFSSIIFYICNDINIWRVIYVNWYRRFFRGWKNSIYG